VLEGVALIERVNELYTVRERERLVLDELRRYATGKQAFPLIIPQDAPREIRRMAQVARVNVIDIVMDSVVQSLIVEYVRTQSTVDSGPDPTAERLWRTWQANRMDGAQSGLYRAVATFGAAYVVGTTGSPDPVIRPMSPRRLTAVYGDDPDWPRYALESRPSGAWRLYDATHVHTLARGERGWELVSSAEHGAAQCPVVRYRFAADLDEDDEPLPLSPRLGRTREVDVVAGQVAPLIDLQDSIDITSFLLKVAEWYAAFRQRYAVGWTPETPGLKMAAAASQLWTFDQDPESMRLGEFAESTLDGYLRSRELGLKYAATLSQTPVHELIGELVNLSAEALAAAEAGRDRKINLLKLGLGESHEQTWQLVGQLGGYAVPVDLEVGWKDTSATAFGALVDGLGKLATMLQVPPSELWERIPGTSQQQLARWRKAAAEGDAIGKLTGLLDQQADPGTRLILPPSRG
jgi:hypothetical protein